LLQAVAYGETVGLVKVPTDPSSTLFIKKGTIWRHHNLRIGVVAQHQIDILSSHLNETPLSYIQSVISSKGAGGGSGTAASSSSSTTEATALSSLYKTDHDIRAHLGAFGLSGNLALQAIGSLSGGQKARLSFAIVCLSRPHLLFLDEPSNHLSLDSIESLITACRDFVGGIVLISHNRYLLSKITNELWCVNGNRVAVRKPLGEGSESKSGKEGGNSGSGGGGGGSDDEREKKNQTSAFNDLLDSCINEILKNS
jgi:ATPase subunit of ABC transporter with duplicated ATPase domains